MNCQVCGGRAQLSLCGTCENDLRLTLTNLADGLPLDVPPGAPPEREGDKSRPLLVSLHDEAVGDTCKGESARRSTDYTTPLPFNPSASCLEKHAHNMLTRWVAAINLTHETLAINDKDNQ